MGLSSNQLTNNAFRVLGLPATASQAAIEQAARRMRIFNDPSRVPPTNWDLNFLGPLVRKRTDVEQAVARLSDPRVRVLERLLWFHQPLALPADAVAASLESAIPVAAAGDPAKQHDAVLSRYAAALLLDPDVGDATRWKNTIIELHELSQSQAFMQYMLDVEQAGEFEKRARGEEVAAALLDLPRQLTQGLVNLADVAFDNENLPQAINVLRLLQSSDRAAAGRLLDRAEDLIDHRCRDMQERLQRNIVFANAPISENLIICRDVAEIYEKLVQPLHAELEKLGADEAHRVERSAYACARSLHMLGTGWIAGGNFVEAENTLYQAYALAHGTRLEFDIKQQIDENFHRAQQQRMAGHRAVSPHGVYSSSQGGAPIEGTPAHHGRRIVPPQQPVVQQMAQAARARRAEERSRKAVGWIWVVAVVGISAFLRFAFNKSDRPTPVSPILTEQIDRMNRNGQKLLEQSKRLPVELPESKPGPLKLDDELSLLKNKLLPPRPAPTETTPVAIPPPPEEEPAPVTSHTSFVQMPLPSYEALFQRTPSPAQGDDLSLTRRVMSLPPPPEQP